MPLDEDVRGAQAVSAFAAYLARGFGCERVVEIGLGPGVRPVPAWPDLAGIRFEDRDTGPADDGFASSVISCRLDAAGPRDWQAALGALRSGLDRASAAILTLDPDDRRARGSIGAARSPAELERWLAGHDLNVGFVGRARGEADRERRMLVAVLGNNHDPARHPAPPEFRVVAIIPTYNEEDVITHALRYLVDQGIEIYLLDNWSTDRTVERARPFLRRGLLAIERFPPGGPSGNYDLRGILTRVEEVAMTLEADWCVLHDADERRRSPWPGVDLRDGLYHVDQCGFTCIDHITLNFWPTDDRHDPTRDVEQQLTYFEFSDHPGHFHQRRAWKNLGRRVSLAWTAGHDVFFDGRLVYPFRFLLKHYPIRSQAHGERKILRERTPRFNAEERSMGWHAQYDALEQDRRFLRDPAELEQADQETLYEKYLIERLSGIGVFREPPSWATPPR